MLENKEQKIVNVPSPIKKLLGWIFFIGLWLVVYGITYSVVLILFEEAEIELFSAFHLEALIITFFLVMGFYYSILFIFQTTINFTTKYYQEKEKEYYEIYKENLLDESDSNTLFKIKNKEHAGLGLIILPLLFFFAILTFLITFFLVILMYLLAFALTYPVDISGLSKNVMNLLWMPIIIGGIFVLLYFFLKLSTPTDKDKLLARKLRLQQKTLDRLEKKYGEEKKDV